MTDNENGADDKCMVTHMLPLVEPALPEKLREFGRFLWEQAGPDANNPFMWSSVTATDGQTCFYHVELGMTDAREEEEQTLASILNASTTLTASSTLSGWMV